MLIGCSYRWVLWRPVPHEPPWVSPAGLLAHKSNSMLCTLVQVRGRLCTCLSRQMPSAALAWVGLQVVLCSMCYGARPAGGGGWLRCLSSPLQAHGQVIYSQCWTRWRCARLCMDSSGVRWRGRSVCVGCCNGRQAHQWQWKLHASWDMFGML